MAEPCWQETWWQRFAQMRVDAVDCEMEPEGGDDDFQLFEDV